MPESDLLDLQKWQAASHPDLANREPIELFPQEFVQRYHRLHSDLWYRIVRVHGTICTLEQLEDFPFDHLYGPNGMEFWRLVAHNFLEMAIVLLHGIINDTGTDTHTITRFKNTIVKGPWLDEKMQDLLRQTLKDQKFDHRTNTIAERVKEIRHTYVAHRLMDAQTGLPDEKFARVELRELRDLFDEIHSLFGRLSFGSGYVTLAGDLMPGMVGGKPTRTCLDEVLDAVLRDSYFVNEPERDEWWSEVRKHKSNEELQLLNKYRKRIGLPEA